MESPGASNPQQPPKRFFSKSLMSLREKLAMKREEEERSSNNPPLMSNTLRKRCFISDPDDEASVKKKKKKLSSPKTLDKPRSSSLSRSLSHSPPLNQDFPPSSTSTRLSRASPPNDPNRSPAHNFLPLESSLSLSQPLTTSEPSPLEKIVKIPSSHLEIRSKNWVDLSYHEVEEAIGLFREEFLNGKGKEIDWNNDERLKALRAKIHSIRFDEGLAHKMPTSHIYTLEEDGPVQASQSGEVSMIKWRLPNKEFEDLWENLTYDTDIKNRLLLIASSLTVFGELGIKSSVISNNRVILLYGPPGTGKTSLCKALAQKLAIRMGNRYSKPSLIEVNAHSLFSKWFSESGKLVTKLFVDLREQLEDEETYLFVLVDEVESLTSARKSALSGSEPSDSIRAVNALLTQIDQLSTYNNVLILTTSNITEAIDAAFVDRADLKQYIGLPSHLARYEILWSCVLELTQKRVVSAEDLEESEGRLFSFEEASKAKKGEGGGERAEASSLLFEIARSCKGLSGRSLRKFPLVAHAFCGAEAPVPLMLFLGVLEKYVAEQKRKLIPIT